MTTTRPHAAVTAGDPAPDPVRRRWPLTAAVGGSLGAAAALLEEHTRSAPLGWVAAALLLLTAAQWRRWVEPRTRSSTAAHLVPLGLLVSAAGVGHGLPGTTWAGAVVAAAALAWMGLRERTVSRVVTAVSLVPPVLTVVLPAGAGAGRSDLLDPTVGAVTACLWLVLVGVGLALRGSTIHGDRRQAPTSSRSGVSVGPGTLRRVV